MTTQEIMAAPAPSMFKASIIEAKKGWVQASYCCVRMSYREAGRRLAHYVLNHDDGDGHVEAQLTGEASGEWKNVEGIRKWLCTARSRWMAIVPSRHRTSLAEGFLDGLEESL
jgi:hypothetical protein